MVDPKMSAQVVFIAWNNNHNNHKTFGKAENDKTANNKAKNRNLAMVANNAINKCAKMVKMLCANNHKPLSYF